jgi:hypothetical protein
MAVSGPIYTPAALPLGENSQHPLNGRLGELQLFSRRYGEDRNLLLLPGTELQFLYCQSRNLVNIQNYTISVPFKKPGNFIIIRLSIFQPASRCPYQGTEFKMHII